MANLNFQLQLRADTADVQSMRAFAFALEQMTSPGQRAVRPVADSVRDGFALNFRTEGSPSGPWRALARRTVRERRAQGFPPHRPILRRSGRYFSSFTRRFNSDHSEVYSSRASGWSLAIGSDDRRVRALEGGTRRIPARPVTLLSRFSEGRIGDALDALYTRLFDRAERS